MSTHTTQGHLSLRWCCTPSNGVGAQDTEEEGREQVEETGQGQIWTLLSNVDFITGSGEPCRNYTQREDTLHWDIQTDGNVKSAWSKNEISINGSAEKQ